MATDLQKGPNYKVNLGNRFRKFSLNPLSFSRLRAVLSGVILSFNIIFFFSTSGYSQQTGAYYYWDGSQRLGLEMVPEHIVDFTPLDQKSEVSQSLKTLAERKLSGNARLYRLAKGELGRSLQQKSIKKSNTSPLFKQGGDYKALAGGVLIWFKDSVSELTAQEFCNVNSLQLKKRYSLEGQPIVWLVETPAGLESLSIANSIKENHSDVVEQARPNFWQAMDTRELKLTNFPQVKQRKIKATKTK